MIVAATTKKYVDSESEGFNLNFNGMKTRKPETSINDFNFNFFADFFVHFSADDKICSSGCYQCFAFLCHFVSGGIEGGLAFHSVTDSNHYKLELHFCTVGQCVHCGIF